MSGTKTMARPAFQKSTKTSRLHLIDKEGDGDLILQLMRDDKNDKVHPTPKSISKFIEYRVGDITDTRQTWVQLSDNGTVEAALYTARFDNLILSPSDFQGNIDEILSTPRAKAETANPETIIFYSVSSFARGAGLQTILNSREYIEQSFSNPIMFSTLSPMRAPFHEKVPPQNANFANWLKTRHADITIIKGDTELLKGEAMTYLSQNINVVQKFHMGNGAYIGDINLRANREGSADDLDALNVMVNYVYGTSEQLAINRDCYNQGHLTIAKHLKPPLHDNRFIIA